MRVLQYDGQVGFAFFTPVIPPFTAGSPRPPSTCSGFCSRPTAAARWAAFEGAVYCLFEGFLKCYSHEMIF